MSDESWHVVIFYLVKHGPWDAESSRPWTYSDFAMPGFEWFYKNILWNNMTQKNINIINEHLKQQHTSMLNAGQCGKRCKTVNLDSEYINHVYIHDYTCVYVYFLCNDYIRIIHIVLVSFNFMNHDQSWIHFSLKVTSIPFLLPLTPLPSDHD
jgi:hypothetical protein